MNLQCIEMHSYHQNKRIELRNQENGHDFIRNIITNYIKNTRIRQNEIMLLCFFINKKNTQKKHHKYITKT